MAPHTGLTAWSLAGTGSDHVISPASSSAPSIVSVDSILSDTDKKSPSVNGISQGAESPIKCMCMDPQVIESLGNRSSLFKYPRVDDLFIRHPKYFFADGNITFLVEGTLYCTHRYFFSRDSVYFSTRFAQLDIRDHEALSTTISLTDIERKDFDALLSILYPEKFEENNLSYEEWKSVLYLSTRWGFASVRKLALSSIEPLTPHDRLLLARKYSVDDWVVPALSALCERMAPLTLSEARQMDIEDVVLVSTVRDDIRDRLLQVDPAEIPRRVEAEQTWALVGGGPRPSQVPPVFSTSKAPLPVDPEGSTKEDDAHKSDGKRSVSPSCGPFWRASAENGTKESPQAGGNISVREGKQAQFMDDSRGEVAATRMVKTGTAKWVAGNVEIQLVDEVAAKPEAEEGAARREEGYMREVEEAARLMVEEKARCKAEKTARRKAKKKERRKAEEEARHKAEEEARRKVEEEVRPEAEEEVRPEAEEEARPEAEEEAKCEAEEEAGHETKVATILSANAG